MMRYWSLALLILMVCGHAIAQDTDPTQAVFFLARDDTDHDGQVTDADNMRLYEVGLDGTVLFVTPPDVHILDYAPSPDEQYEAAVIAQTMNNKIKVQIYNAAGALATELGAENTSYIEWIEWSDGEVAWESYEKDLDFLNIYHLDTQITKTVHAEKERIEEITTLTLQGESFLLQDTLNDNLLIVQHIGSEPADALWIYEKAEDRLTPFSAWLYTEPLLLATFSQGPRLAILGREFDGSMSLYTVDLSAGVEMPLVTQVLSGLIDPPYTAMEWTSGGTSLLLVGESGDFVVSNIGRIEAVYVLTLSTGAFTRLSPEGTLVERASITSR